jgi:hypothetical protein
MNKEGIMVTVKFEQRKFVFTGASLGGLDSQDTLDKATEFARMLVNSSIPESYDYMRNGVAEMEASVTYEDESGMIVTTRFAKRHEKPEDEGDDKE